ncbi:DUF1152 domain-containing protein [Nocardia abscessus]|uniref:DUF1152 domain-containing protein n=1 Tax=Nocardia abscessus TaxID=120957 RepID=UPI00245891E3|nr:DUF1152 domain-containing protein [Nocardia abscessus]
MAAVAIAAGGGGDAVTAAVLADMMPALRVAAIMSFSWDRLIIDPTPGPRSRGDFRGLIDRGGVSEVPSTATLRTEGESTLPRLSKHIEQPLLLMDVEAGANGLARQIRCAADAFDADELAVIDTGGDILATGTEPGLRSPLADSVALAAAISSGLTTQVLVAGVGLDGELSPAELDARLIALDAKEVGNLIPDDAKGFASIWSWHPSEANALLAAAASGWRGCVETQRGAVVDVTDAATRVYRIAATALSESSLAALLARTSSLHEIEQLLREHRGYSDIDVERDRLLHRARPRMPDADTLTLIDGYTADAYARGVDALTVRRVIELTGATYPAATAALRDHLARSRPDNFRPPLYTVQPTNRPRSSR